MPKLTECRAVEYPWTVYPSRSSVEFSTIPQVTGQPHLARVVCACGLLVSSLSLTSCLFQKKARVFTPPPVVAKVTPPPIRVEIPEVLPPPPELTIAVLSSVDPGDVFVEDLPLLPPPPPPRPVAPKPARTPEPAPVIVETPPQPPPAKPAQIFTAEERRVYSRDFDMSMEEIRRALGQVQGKRLNTEQRQIVSQVTTLQKQAEQLRDEDLVTALNLARRAASLARDLIVRLR